MVFKQIDVAASRRTATVLMFIKTGHGPARTVFLPLRHRTMIERIYERGRFERTLAPASDVSSRGRAQLAVEIFPKWSEASLRVVAYGADPRRSRALPSARASPPSHRLDQPRSAASHPAAAQVCEQIEALGFFFAGVIPSSWATTSCAFSTSTKSRADLESVHSAPDFARDLFAYVVEVLVKAQALSIDAAEVFPACAARPRPSPDPEQCRSRNRAWLGMTLARDSPSREPGHGGHREQRHHPSSCTDEGWGTRRGSP